MFLMDQQDPSTEPLLVFSASDLVAASECEYRLLRTLDEKVGRAAHPATEVDDMLERTATLGDVHEQQVLAGFVDLVGADAVREVPVPRTVRRADLEAAHAATLDALRDGVDVVYQGSFFDGRFHGRADFLIRTDSRAAHAWPHATGPTTSGTLSALRRGGPEYAVYDAKLARRAKVPALLQLAAYADQLLAAGVETSPVLHLILGTRAVTDHRLADVLPVFRERRSELLRLLDSHRASGEPVAWDAPGLRQCGTCAYCAQQVTEHDDVLRVAGLRSTQRVRLRAAGITTMTQLASATTPPQGLAARTFETLRVQARLQAGLVDVPADGGGVPDVGPGPSGSVTWSTPADAGDAERADGVGAPAEPERHTLSYVVVDPTPLRDLPRPDPGDVFFDFEGDPLWSAPDASPEGIVWNIDYLFGLVERPGSPGEKPPFTAFWAHDLDQERQALVDFVDYLAKRRAQYPGLHVYHYAPYEKTHLLSIAARHGVYEQEVDDLLREGVLVDLYSTVRHSLKVSAPSYSIKKLEPLYMGDQLRGGDVTDAAASVVAYATYCAARDAGRTEEAERLLHGIADYNEYDCLSTLRLHEFLLGLAGRAAPATSAPGPVAAPLGTGWEDDLPPALELSDAEVARRAKRAEAEQVELDVRALAGGVDGRSGDGRTDDEEAVALLGAGVGYYWREAKPFWQEFFARLKEPVDQWQTPRAYFLVERAEVIEDWAKATPRSNPSRRLRLYGELPDGSELKAGYDGATALFEGPAPDGIEPARGAARWSTGSVRVHGLERGRLGNGREVDVLDVRLPVPKGVSPHDVLPMALTVGQVLPTPQQEASIRALATAVQAQNPCGPQAPLVLPDHPAIDLLRRRPPRTVSGAPLPVVGHGPERYVDAVTDAVRDLDGSYLGVQGPPGTGKTHLASKVVGRLVAEGWRVGVVAQSHDVVENVLAGVITKGGVPADRVGKKASGPKGRDVSAVGRDGGPLPDDVAAASLPDGSRLVPWRLVDSPQTAAFVAEGPCVVGGTAWDFAHAERFGDGELDLLVIDEAGQFSLANTIAVSRAAQRLLLLGDPQQLPQVSQGQHPEPVDQSALGWLTRAGGGHDVLPPEFGYFLARSWRMHPALCAAVSELAYEGLLHAEAAAGERLLVGVEPGVHVVEVEHAGNAVSSVEEAQEVVRQVKALLGTTWYPGGPGGSDGTPRDSRALTEDDFVVVAPYNAQVWTVRHALAAAGLGEVRVGTVDKFQGKEAPVAIVSMTASAREDVPRGMEFLLSRNRVNVAVSRGQWCAVVVRSPRLTDYLPNHPEELAELGAFIGLCSSGVAPLR